MPLIYKNDIQYEVAGATDETIANQIMAFAIMIQVLFVGVSGSLGVATLIGTLGTIILLRPTAFAHHIISRPLPHVFWLLGICSIVWSIEPALTLRYSVQLALTTFMAMSLTGLGQGRGAMEGIAIAYPIFLVVSVVSGHSVGMGASGGTAFSGLTGSKNLLAGDALAGVLACLAAAFSSFEAGKTARSMVFGGAAIGAVFVMLLARSSGSILTLLLIGPMMIGMLFVRNGPAALRSVAVIVIVLVAITASAFAQPLTDWATDIAMSVFHKDPTLTGRLYLWQRSADIIKERPWLGVGYNAFWVQGHIDAEGLWRWGGIQSRGGFNFHNTVLEVLVHFGYIGLGILIVSLSTCVAMFARLFILGASVLQVYWLAALACMMVSIGWESYLPTPFNSSSFTVLAAFCAACSSPYLPRSPLGVNRRVRRLGGN